MCKDFGTVPNKKHSIINDGDDDYSHSLLNDKAS